MSKASRAYKIWAKTHQGKIGYRRKLRSLREYRMHRRHIDRINKDDDKRSDKTMSRWKVDNIAINRLMDELNGLD